MTENSELWIQRAAIALTTLGVATFFFGAIVSSTPSAKIWRKLELPMGDANSIAVDQAGRIYCALGFYGRIQVYDAKGKFVVSWPGKAGLRLRVNNLNQLEAVASGGDDDSAKMSESKVTSDESGAVVKREVGANIYETFGQESDSSAVGPSGDRYLLQNRFLASRFMASRIVRIRANHEDVIVDPGWVRELLAGPFPAFLYIIVGGAVLRQSRHRLKEKPPAEYLAEEKSSRKSPLLIAYSILMNAVVFLMVLSWGKPAAGGAIVFGSASVLMGFFCLKFPHRIAPAPSIVDDNPVASARIFGLNVSICGFTMILAAAVAYFR